MGVADYFQRLECLLRYCARSPFPLELPVIDIHSLAAVPNARHRSPGNGKGGVPFEPQEIDSDSGVGKQVTAGDVNKDGKPPSCFRGPRMGWAAGP